MHNNMLKLTGTQRAYILLAVLFTSCVINCCAISSGFAANQPTTQTALTAAARLQAADEFRLDGQQARVDTEVTEFNQGTPINQRSYHVYLDGKNSLVIFKSAAETGQKMLMLDQQYWLIMPRSRRPIRITPMQKLLGQASIGDIATLSWQQDYRIESSQTVTLNAATPRACLQLQLVAKTAGSSYQRITLWLAIEDNFPVRAAFYLASGKLAKLADFTAGEINGKRRVVSMRLHDALQPSKATDIRYLAVTPQQLPSKYFNPVFLTRTALEQM